MRQVVEIESKVIATGRLWLTLPQNNQHMVAIC